MSEFVVNYLGCGSASPSERHRPSCQVVDFRGRLFMIDCGEGAQMEFRKMHLKFSRLSHVFISHLHGDHFLGLPGLLSTMSLHEMGGVVTVHAFEEGLDILKRIMDVFCRERSFELRYEPIDKSGGLLLDDKSLTVEAFPLYHRVPTVGFVFREKAKGRRINGPMVEYFNVPVSFRPKLREGYDYVKDDGEVIANSRLTFDAEAPASYAYCSDTRFDARVAAAVAGVDTLYHESTYLENHRDDAAPRGHSTACDAGKIASMAGVRRLVLGHYSRRYDDDEAFVREASTMFNGEIVAAREGLKLSI